MKKRYFHALLLLLVAVWLLPQSMRADQPYVKLAVADNATSISASNSLSLTFCYGTKGTDSDTEKYFDLNEGNNTPGWLGTYSGGVYAYASKVKTATFDNSFADARPTSTMYWFKDCSNLTAINGISNLNTSEVTTMYQMFKNCESLTSLDLSNFNTASVTIMKSMFSGCSALTSLDLSSFNTDKVTQMSYMFQNCSSLTSLDLSSFNTASVKTMGYMFQNCSSLTSLNLSSFNTTEVTDMKFMFYGCTNLASIHVDLLNWTTDALNNSENMFYECSKLPSYNSSNVTADYCNTYLTYHFKDTYDGTALSSKLTSLKDGGTTLQSLVLERAFTKDIYGTICLPVALTAAQVTSTFGEGTVVKSLTGATYDETNNRLTLTFTKASSMTAGVPYLIMSAKTDPETITGATIGATTGGNTGVINSLCQMHGVLSPYELAASENNLFVSNGTLYYSTGGTMNGMRAYFTLHGNAATAAESLARPRAVISPDDDPSETGIFSINADGSLTYEETGDWYTLGGVKLSGKPATKGMYILNGKKYIVK